MLNYTLFFGVRGKISTQPMGYYRIWGSREAVQKATTNQQHRNPPCFFFWGGCFGPKHQWNYHFHINAFGLNENPFCGSKFHKISLSVGWIWLMQNLGRIQLQPVFNVEDWEVPRILYGLSPRSAVFIRNSWVQHIWRVFLHLQCWISGICSR